MRLGGTHCNCPTGRGVLCSAAGKLRGRATRPVFLFLCEGGKYMTSKTKKLKIVRKNKSRANKANLKANQKRIDKNIAFLRQERSD